jgi:hypothetical protein
MALEFLGAGYSRRNIVPFDFELPSKINSGLITKQCVGGLCLLKVVKNTTNMLSKYNILSQEPSALR